MKTFLPQTQARSIAFTAQRQFKGASTPPPPPPPIPPVRESSMEVAQAQDQQRRDAAKRKGFASTLLAGETGGTKEQPKTLLG